MHLHLSVMRSPLSHYISTASGRRSSGRRAIRSASAPASPSRRGRAQPAVGAAAVVALAFTASFAANDHRELREWRERWSTPDKAVARHDLIWRTLKQYDLLGTTDEFYESTLLVARTLNWSLHVTAPERACSSAIPARSSWSVALRRNSRVDVFILFLTASLPHTSETGTCADRPRSRRND